MIGPFGAMYRLDLYLNQRLTFIGSSRFIAAIHIAIYLALIGSAAEIAHFLWPRSHQVVWITNNWCWLPIPIEFAYMLYALCRHLLECKTSEPPSS